MSSLDDLYQEIILDHNKRPRNFGPLAGATHHADGRNPLCGDEMKVTLKIREGRVEAIHFQGQGCAISKASASIMTETLEGKSVDQAKSVAGAVIAGLVPDGADTVFRDAGDLAALSGVRRFPARLKCATLAWHAVVCALEGGTETTSEKG